MLLSFGTMPLFFGAITSINYFGTNTAFCKIRAYMNQFSAMSCRWLLVMACVDRSVASSSQAGLRRLSTSKNARYIASFLLVVWTILPVHLLIFADTVVNARGISSCVINDYHVSVYHGIYAIVLGGLLPPIILIVCSFIIWRNLRQRIVLRRMARLAQSFSVRRNDQILMILLIQVVIFLISTIPFLSNTLYGALTRAVTVKSADRLAIEGFVQVFTELFVYIFPASSFYSNTLTSKIFRSELHKLLKKLNPCKNYQVRRVEPHMQMSTYRNVMVGAKNSSPDNDSFEK